MERLLDYRNLSSMYELLSDSLLTGSDKVNKDLFFIDLYDNINMIIDDIHTMKYSFRPFKQKKVSDNRVVYIPTVRDRIVIQSLNYTLINKFRIQFGSRKDITESIIRKLRDTSEYTILRLDIKMFFDSIPTNKLLHTFKTSNLITFQEYHLLKGLLSQQNIGIPQGLSISSALSEIYLENFDYFLKHIHPQLNYYSRYVDDILLIFNGKISEKEINLIREHISEYAYRQFGLELHSSSDKYSLSYFDFKNGNVFEYLGYTYSKNSSVLKIDIANKKVKKIQAQITRAFISFSKDKNYNLLYHRIRLLLGSYSFIKRKGKFKINKPPYFYPIHIKCGLIENYIYINTDDALRRINTHFSYFCSVNKPQLSAKQYRTLVSLSLYHNNQRNNTSKHLSFHKYDKDKFIEMIEQITDKNQYKGTWLRYYSLNELKHIYFKIIQECYLIY